MKKNKTHELRKRLLFTLLILAGYMVGRSLLLYNVDSSAYQFDELDSQNIIFSMISGDRHRYTFFALGIMPYITANLIMWVIMAIRGNEYRSRLSPQKIERFSLILMIIIAVAFALSRANELIFKQSNFNLETLKVIAVSEMTVGAVIIYKMATSNKEHGIGAQIPIILVNVLDNLISTLQKSTWDELYRPLILCLCMALVILVMENVIIRIPVQRVSIHNVYADKSYIAFKLDPIGVMPVMFATAFFMIPQLFIRLLLLFYQDNNTLLLIYEELNLTNIIGVIVYLGIIFALNVIFSFVMLSPGEMAEQLQRGGDSIVNVYAGKKTKKYLRKRVLQLSTFSSCVLCLMMGISLGLSLKGEISSQLALFPTTGMMLIGILCPLYREVKTYRRFDSYSFFM